MFFCAEKNAYFPQIACERVKPLPKKRMQNTKDTYAIILPL